VRCWRRLCEEWECYRRVGHQETTLSLGAGVDLHKEERHHCPNGEIDGNGALELYLSPVRAGDTTTRNEDCGIGHPKRRVEDVH
jgi:hypothetical protein